MLCSAFEGIWKLRVVVVRVEEGIRSREVCERRVAVCFLS